MQILTETRKFPGPRTADGAILGTMLAGPPPWQSCHGGDIGYAVDPATGGHTDVDNLYGTYHGVLVQWTGSNFAEGFVVAWCSCHADHPVVAAAREGRLIAGDPAPQPRNGMNEDRDIPRFGADETGPFD